MKLKEIHQTIQFSAPPDVVYKTIMDSALHSEFTQSESHIGENVGDPYHAYDGYIEGRIVELVPYRRIMKTWIAHEDGWPEDHISEVMFEFFPNDYGTEMQFTHSGVPEDLYESFREGWTENYWEPMQEVFEKQATASAE